MNDDLKPFVSDNNKKKIVFYNNIFIDTPIKYFAYNALVAAMVCDL